MPRGADPEGDPLQAVVEKPAGFALAVTAAPALEINPATSLSAALPRALGIAHCLGVQPSDVELLGQRAATPHP